MKGKQITINALVKYVLIASFALLLSQCGKREPLLEEFAFNGSTMGTTYHIKIVREQIDLQTRSSIAEKVDSLLKDYNNSLSTYDAHSEISRFNQNASTQPIEVSDLLLPVVQTGLDLCEQSGGAFDITVMPIVNFFGFGFEPGENRFPTVEEIDSWLELTGCDGIVTTDSTLTKSDPRISIDLSAIAKGDAADLVTAFLEAYGYRDIFVEIGGEIVTRGTNRYGEQWQIGIDRPVWSGAPGADLQHVIQLSDMAVASSGDYRNYREVEGQRVTHMIDPRNGTPIAHNLAAVTVIATSCRIADGLATTVMILGPEAGLEWLERYSSAEGLLIIRNPDGAFSESMTSGFSAYIRD